MHSWLYYNDQEATKKVDYKGWIKKLDLGNVSGLPKLSCFLCHSWLRVVSLLWNLG